MLFRRKIERKCGYCIHATQIEDNQALCIKRGVVASDGKCRKFKYDPTKRIPLKAKAQDFSKYDNEDFSL